VEAHEALISGRCRPRKLGQQWADENWGGRGNLVNLNKQLITCLLAALHDRYDATVSEGGVCKDGGFPGAPR
jgi:hypothetical protein